MSLLSFINLEETKISKKKILNVIRLTKMESFE